MSARSATPMDALEIAEFLEGQGTGVLSLARDDDGYGIPVSFTYVADDEDGPQAYLRLGYGPDSQKRAYVDAASFVSLVVYDHTDGGWKSVVARGSLEELAATTIDSSIVESVRNLDIPFVAVFDRPPEDVQFSIARIDVEELTGITAEG